MTDRNGSGGTRAPEHGPQLATVRQIAHELQKILLAEFPTLAPRMKMIRGRGRSLLRHLR